MKKFFIRTVLIERQLRQLKLRRCTDRSKFRFTIRFEIGAPYQVHITG